MSPLFTPQFDFRTGLYYGFLGTVGLCFLVYMIFQARFILAGPQIVLAGEIASVQTERVVKLSGTTANIVELSLNGRVIYTDKGGHFTEALVLENGYTIATLTAKDRYGRTQSVTKNFVYTPALAHE